MKKLILTATTVVLVLIIAKVAYDLFIILPEKYVYEYGSHTEDLASYKNPAPELTAEDVVEIQLEALKNNDESDKGIERAFNFTSSYIAKDEKTLRSFTNIVKSERFCSILNYSGVEKSPVRYHYNTAFQMVQVTDQEDRKVIFLFTLTRHLDKPYKGCWLTESVRKIKEEEPFEHI